MRSKCPTSQKVWSSHTHQRDTKTWLTTGARHTQTPASFDGVETLQSGCAERRSPLFFFFSVLGGVDTWVQHLYAVPRDIGDKPRKGETRAVLAPSLVLPLWTREDVALDSLFDGCVGTHMPMCVPNARRPRKFGVHTHQRDTKTWLTTGARHTQTPASFDGAETLHSGCAERRSPLFFLFFSFSVLGGVDTWVQHLYTVVHLGILGMMVVRYP